MPHSEPEFQDGLYPQTPEDYRAQKQGEYAKRLTAARAKRNAIEDKKMQDEPDTLF